MASTIKRRSFWQRDGANQYQAKLFAQEVISFGMKEQIFILTPLELAGAKLEQAFLLGTKTLW